MDERNYWTRTFGRRVSRRSMLRGAGIAGVGLAGAALIGCGDDDDDDVAAPAPAAGGGGQAAPAATVDPDAPRAGGTIRYATITVAPHFSAWHPGADPSFINTFRRDNGYYDTLWDIRESNDPARIVQNILAETIEQVSETEVVVTMREAFFHDNPKSDSNAAVGARQITAEDVVARIEFLQDTDNNGAASSNSFLATELASVEAIDDLTIRYVTNRPAAFFFEENEGVRIRGYELPREMLDVETLKNHAPIGTGPYMYDGGQQGSSEKALRNPNYWNGDLPYIERKEVTLVPDAAAQEAAFRAGQIDVLGFQDVRQANSISEDLSDRITHVTYPSTSGMAMMLNIRRDPWKDQRAREAFHRAINVQRIIDVVYFGDGERSWYFNPAATTRFPLGYDNVDQYVGYDPQKAAQLLAASDYDGRKLNLMLPVEAQTWVDGGRLVGEDLNEIGFNTENDPQPRNIYLGRAGNKSRDDLTASSDFDITMTVFLAYHHTTSTTRSFWNNASLDDPVIDGLVDRIVTTVDAEARAELSHEFETELAKRATNMVPLLTVNSHIGWYNHVRNVDFEVSRSGTTGYQVGMWLDT